MIALEPESRPSFEAALQSSRNVVFPDSFYSFFHQYISSLNELSSPSPFSRTTPPPSTGIEGRSGSGDGFPIPSECDRRIESIWTEFSSVMPFLVPEEEGPPSRMPLLSLDQGNSNTIQNVFPVHIHVPQLRSALRKPEDQIPQAAATGKCFLHLTVRQCSCHRLDGAALLILSLVCANLRYCTVPSSRLRGLDILLAISQYLTDEAKLDRLIPYVVDLTQDDAASVRAAALCTILQVVRTSFILSLKNL
jgi:phosphoinositide-3-kinase regulatory subunit 4